MLIAVLSCCTGVITGGSPEPDIRAVQTAGTIEDSLSVGLNGNARYQIPIDVPPGLGAIVPQLALSYSSATGNGPQGIGFSLSGVPQIRRCFQTIANDEHRLPLLYNDKDRFCLDGERLEVSFEPKARQPGASGQDGTTYSTEVESFRHVTSKGRKGEGPAYFEAWYPGLLQYRFGDTADSAVTQAGRSEVLAWTASHVEDLNGNTMDFRYINEGGQHLLKEILYGANSVAGTSHFAKVVLQYEERSDQTTSYQAGEAIHHTLRLRSIRTYVGETLVLRYELGYESAPLNGISRLLSVRKCSEDECLPATKFDWQDGRDDYEARNTGIDSKYAASTYFPDVNGDGRPDMLIPKDGSWHVRFANVNSISFTEPFDTGAELINIGTGTKPLYSAFPFNADGDSRRDILVANSDSNRWNIIRHKGGSTFEVLDTKIGDARYESGSVTVAGDLNGDGLDELIGVDDEYPEIRLGKFDMQYEFGWLMPERYRARLLAIVPTDFNGDGLMDLVVEWGKKNPVRDVKRTLYKAKRLGPNEIVLGAQPLPIAQFHEEARYWKSGSEYLKPGSRRMPAELRPITLDINGDGLADSLTTSHPDEDADGNSYWELRMGSTEPGEVTGRLLAQDVTVWPPVVIDLDSDGSSEILLPSEEDSWSVLRLGAMTDTSDVLERSSFTSMFSIDKGILAVIDVDGDGLQDLMAPSDGTWKIQHRLGSFPNLLVGVTNGLGARTTLSYKPLTDRSCHTPAREHTLEYPTRSYNVAHYVVSSMKRSTGTGGVLETTYHYEGARADILGRGFLGFSKQRETTGDVITIRNMETQWPRNGMVLHEEKQRAGDKALLAETDYQLATMFCNRGRCAQEADSYPQMLLPVITTSVAKQYYTDTGRKMTTTETTFGSDGRPIKRIVTDEQNGQEIRTEVKLLSAAINAPLVGKAELAGYLSGGSKTAETAGGITANRNEHFQFDSRGNRTGHFNITEDASQYFSFIYERDVFGNIASTRDYTQSQDSTVDTYSDDGRFLLTSVDPKGFVTTREYDPRSGMVVREVAPGGLETQRTYDGFSRILTEVSPRGATMRWIRRSRDEGAGIGMRLDVERPGEPNTRTIYDQLGRVRRLDTILDKTKTSTAMSVVLTDYDLFGRLARRSVPGWYGGAPPIYETFSYDLLNRQVEHVSAAGVTTKTSYGDDSVSSTSTDAQGMVRSQVLRHDARGQVVRRKVGDAIASYRYGPFGTMIRVTDPENNQVSMSYDDYGRRTQLDDPDLGVWTFAHDGHGREVSRVGPNGNEVKKNYDTLGRPSLEQVHYADNGEMKTDTLAYYQYDDEFPKVISSDYASGKGQGFELSHLYNEYGERTETTRGYDYPFFDDETEDVQYDELGRIASKTGPLATKTEYGYGESGAIVSLRFQGELVWEALEFDARGNVIRERFGSGVESTRTTDPATGHTLAIKTGGGEVQDLRYDYDGFGNLLARHDSRSGHVEEFSYDALDRLLGVTLDGQEEETFAYSASGNILSRSSVGDFLYEGVQPHAVTSAGGALYSYDLEGNMVQGDGRDLSYTPISKPSTVGRGEDQTHFAYGPDRELWESRQDNPRHTERQYGGRAWDRTYYDGSTDRWILRSRIAAGRSVKALFVATQEGSEESQDLQFYHMDHLGSLDAITDMSGQVVERQSFSVFGERRKQDWSSLTGPDALDESLESRGFTGHVQLDRVGLIHMGGRAYDPKLGRFTSPDPIIQAPENSQNLNRYSYVLNNPLSYTDPTGHMYEALGSDGNATSSSQVASRILERGFSGGQCSSSFTMGGGVDTGVPTALPKSDAQHWYQANVPQWARTTVDFLAPQSLAGAAAETSLGLIRPAYLLGKAGWFAYIAKSSRYATVYRGDLTGKIRFLSSKTRTHGSSAARKDIASDSFEALGRTHSASSAGSPFVSVSGMERIAGHYANKVDGMPVSIHNATKSVYTLRIPRSKLLKNRASIHPRDREYLVPERIPARWVLKETPAW